MKKGGIILAFEILVLSAVFATMVSAQGSYPSRAVEVVSPNAAGGALDFALQLFKPRVEKVLGKPLIMDYKPAAGGIQGTLYAKDAKPDGYTLMAATVSTLVLAQLTKKGAAYGMDDFTPVCNLTSIPILFCVKEDSPYKTMEDFIRTAKTKKMKYATPGTYYNVHILMEGLSRMAGFQATHIPQTGTAAGMAAVMGGHLDMLIASSSGFAGPGKLRILATAEQNRLDDYPDVRTLKEIGYPLVIESLDSLWAPRGVPKEIVSVLFDAHKKAYALNKEAMDKLGKTGEQRVLILTGDELKRRYQDQYDFYKKILGEMAAVKQ
jgi:tripartite-type tricarboxylate transporter receptor subunit TctC